MATIDSTIQGFENTVRWTVQRMGIEKIAFSLFKLFLEFYWEMKYQVSFKFGWYID